MADENKMIRPAAPTFPEIPDAQHAVEAAQPRLPRPVPRKKRHGDRKEGRLLRTIYPMNKFMPFIMPERSDACNTYADELDVTETDLFCKEMIRKGYENFSFLHLMVAAYVRVVSQKPGLNRFISGQRIYSRNNIEMTMTVKKTMSADSPDTCIKVILEPDDTVIDVYQKLNAVIEANKATSDLDSDFDKTAEKLSKTPRFILRNVVKLLNWLDYHGWLPQALLDVSPFHGSMIITDMGSLRLGPVYHHIYNFGTLPVFIAFGAKRHSYELDRHGEFVDRKVADFKFVLDERIVDGHYYAAFLNRLRYYFEHPELLELPPETVIEDVD